MRRLMTLRVIASAVGDARAAAEFHLAVDRRVDAGRVGGVRDVEDDGTRRA